MLIPQRELRVLQTVFPTAELPNMQSSELQRVVCRTMKYEVSTASRKESILSRGMSNLVNRSRLSNMVMATGTCMT